MMPSDRYVSAIKRTLFFLFAAYLVIAPASVSSWAISDPTWARLKLIRIGVLGLTLIISLRWFHYPKAGTASKSLLNLAIVFLLAGIWSDSPHLAFAYKGLFLVSIFTGMSFARVVSSWAELTAFARSIVLVGIIAMCTVAFELRAGGSGNFSFGRLWVFGMNPNLLAQSAAVFAIMGMFIVQVERDTLWKVVGWSCFSGCTALTLLSGSRGGALMAGMGSVACILAVQRSFSRVGGAAVAVAIVCVGVFWLTDPKDLADDFSGTSWLTDVSQDNSYRLMSTDLVKDTRTGVWRSTFRTYLRNPILGIGWYRAGSGWGTVMNAYLQIVVEAGLLGILFVFLFFHALSRRIKFLFWARRSGYAIDTLTALMVALCVALAFHGLLESSLVLGTSPEPFLFGFSVAQIDLSVQKRKVAMQQRHLAPSPDHSSELAYGSTKLSAYKR